MNYEYRQSDILASDIKKGKEYWKLNHEYCGMSLKTHQNKLKVREKKT